MAGGDGRESCYVASSYYNEVMNIHSSLNYNLKVLKALLGHGAKVLTLKYVNLLLLSPFSIMIININITTFLVSI